MSGYEHISYPHNQELELSPFRATPASRVSSLHDDGDFVSSIATERGDDEMPSMSPGTGARDLGHSEAEDSLDNRMEVRSGAMKTFLGNDKPSQGTRQRTTRSTCKPLDGDSWAWEIAAVILSLVMSGITVLTLILIDNKKLPDLPIGITPNTLISILTTISKSSLLFTVGQCLGQLKWVWFSRRGRPMKDMGTFDEASRGPWGSLQLIWRTKGA